MNNTPSNVLVYGCRSINKKTAPFKRRSMLGMKLSNLFQRIIDMTDVIVQTNANRVDLSGFLGAASKAAR